MNTIEGNRLNWKTRRIVDELSRFPVFVIACAAIMLAVFSAPAADFGINNGINNYSAKAGRAATETPSAVSISFSGNAAGTSFVPIYTKAICAGRAGEGLCAAWRDQLRDMQREIGFKYIRFSECDLLL
jgi:hypothetical protein